MRLLFCGADKEVTGSAHLLEVNGKKILIDCGMQQGGDVKDNQAFPFDAREIDYVLLTHAHIDHSGRLPLLVKEGFRGEIHTTGQTGKLISIMLLDSAHIQENDAKWENQKGKRAGRTLVEPLYTTQDAQQTLELVVTHPYQERIFLTQGVEVRFVDAGHLLGSASIEVLAEEGGVRKKIVFSGDIGNRNQPIIRDPQYIREADYVVMESTYGNRVHENCEDYTAALAEIIEKTLNQGGNVVIPSFAVGRTQELLYFIREIKERGLVASIPNFPVYVDSPLSSEATKIYSGDLTGYLDDETIQVIQRGANPLLFPDLHLCDSVEQSKQLNSDGVPKVIISSSGMCEAGRIRHHLKHNLWRPESSIVFVGFQAGGTLGRMLIDGVKKVKLFGEEIVVNAGIYNFRALSAHADLPGLTQWINAFEQRPSQIFVVHGEQESCASFTKMLNELGFHAYAPNFQAEYDLADNYLVDAGEEPVPKQKGVTPAFARLVAAANYLMKVVHKNKGVANRELGKFADQIIALSQKWDR